MMIEYYYYCEYCEAYGDKVKFRKSPLAVIAKTCSCGYKYYVVKKDNKKKSREENDER